MSPILTDAIFVGEPAGNMMYGLKTTKHSPQSHKRAPMPAPNDHVPQSCPIDLWEVLNTIAHIPPSKGPSVYSKANRTAMNETFNHFYRLAGSTESTGADCPINKNLALNWLKSNILFHVHQCDASPNGSEERAQEQARIDAFSAVYDLIRFNL